MKFNQSLIYFGILLLLSSASAFQDWSADICAKKWNDYAFNKLTEQLNKKINTNIAKNVILFLGDGLFDRLVKLLIAYCFFFFFNRKQVMVWEFRLLQQEGLEKDKKTAETEKRKLRLWRGKVKLYFSFMFFFNFI